MLGDARRLELIHRKVALEVCGGDYSALVPERRLPTASTQALPVPTEEQMAEVTRSSGELPHQPIFGGYGGMPIQYRGRDALVERNVRAYLGNARN